MLERMTGVGSGQVVRGRERWESQLAAHSRHLETRLGPGAPARIFFSPGRVNLMGAHLDYNGGPVMPTAVDRGTFIAARPARGRRLRLASTLDGATLEVDLSTVTRQRTGWWVDYPLGVLLEILALVRQRDLSASLTGLDVLFGGNLPIGAGLSSSASICVGTALALDRMWELGLDRMDFVQAALRAEREFVGVQCGIMDPYAVGLARDGQLLWLDCKDGSSTYIPIDPARHAIAVADTLVRRELAQVAFNERVRQCRSAFEALREHQPDASCLRDIRFDTFDAHRGTLVPTVARRAEHVIREVARTFAARDALARGDTRGLGAEMFRAHDSLRDLFEVSVPELDHLVASAATSPGVLGARLTGAGFGGCVVILLETAAGPGTVDRIASEFEQRFGRRPSIELYGGDAGPREVAGPRGSP
jgi:galactokinase